MDATYPDGRAVEPHVQSSLDGLQQIADATDESIKLIMDALASIIDCPAQEAKKTLGEIVKYIKGYLRALNRDATRPLDDVIAYLAGLLDQTTAITTRQMDVVINALNSALPNVNIAHAAGQVPSASLPFPLQLQPIVPLVSLPKQISEPPGQHPGTTGGSAFPVAPSSSGEQVPPIAESPVIKSVSEQLRQPQSQGQTTPVPQRLPTPETPPPQLLPPQTTYPSVPVVPTGPRAPEIGTLTPPSVEPNLPSDTSVSSRAKNVEVMGDEFERGDEPAPTIMASIDGEHCSVGDAVWCASVENVIRAADDFGKWVIDSAQREVEFWTDDKGILQGVISFLGIAADISQEWASSLRGRINQFVKQWYNGANQVYNLLGCGTLQLNTTLELLRSFMRALDHFRIGTDAGLWATIDIQVRWLAIDKIIDYLINHTCPVVIPDTAHALSCLQHGRITRDQFNCWMLMHGHSPCVWEPVVQAGRRMLDDRQAIEMSRRIGENRKLLGQRLKHNGWLTSNNRAEIEALYDRLMNEGEWLHFFSTGAAYKNFSELTGTNEDFDDIFWPAAGDSLRAQGVTKDIARANWRAHWTMPPEQIRREMLYRLRPGAVPQGQQFTDDDYRTSLLGDRHTEYWTDRLDAIKYRPINYRQIRQLLDAGVLTRQETEAAYLNMGYSPETARKESDMQFVLAGRRHQAEIEGWTPARLSYAFARGCIDADAVKLSMQQLSFSPDDAAALMQTASAIDACRLSEKWQQEAQRLSFATIERAYKDGSINRVQASTAIEALGAIQRSASSIIDAWDLQETYRRNKEARDAVKRGWRSGFVGSRAAIGLLMQTNMGPQQAADEVNIWEAENSVEQHMGSAKETLRMVADGEIPIAAGAARLSAMNWEPHEAELLLADAANKLRAAAVRQESQQAAGARRAAKAAEALAIQASKTYKAAAAEIKRQTPRATLRGWLKRGRISESKFRQRMAIMGFTPEVIETEVRDATESKAGKNGQATSTTSPDAGIAGKSPA